MALVSVTEAARLMGKIEQQYIATSSRVNCRNLQMQQEQKK